MGLTVATIDQLLLLSKKLDGELKLDDLHRRLFATDASVYQERPIGVAFPATTADLQRIVNFCAANKVAMIPRSGGTSLAGQCVGAGLVVDVSRYLNKILHFDPLKRTVTVQPGVIRDELNAFLRPYDLQFAPITSTANRATIGGMVGNNSCGTNSIVYGDTRRYVSAIEGFLSDGSPISIAPLSEAQLNAKCQSTSLEGSIYNNIHTLLSDPAVAQDIHQHFPKASVSRRNTGYALDALLQLQPYNAKGQFFSLAPLLAGAEGTLMMMAEITLDLVPLPPPVDVVMLCHFKSIAAAMGAVTRVMQHQPYACELMDKTILDCTRGSLQYEQTLSYFQGQPEAVLMVEFRAKDTHTATLLAQKLQTSLVKNKQGYAYPIVAGSATKSIWALRSAGLGLLANIPGDEKGVACIEDTAVATEDLADYMAEFAALMESFDQNVVYYAHAGAGEIHLRPILNLKHGEDQQKFYDITLAVAKLVKKHRGSLSGEHGDGRVRAPFIPLVMGQENYQRFQYIKQLFDPDNIFNPGKIVDAPPMNEQLRFEADQTTPTFTTVLDFSSTGGLLRMAEKCNGSGDCRKLPLSGGTMCPSYQATREEQHTTRGRANILRQILTENKGKNAFNHPALKEVLDLCISCKGCTSECPSNVDMASLKAEFLHQYYQSNSVTIRARAFAHINRLNRLGSYWPGLTNWVLNGRFSGGLLKKMLGVAPQRTLPKLHNFTLQDWYKKHYKPRKNSRKTVFLFCDEFTNFNDTSIGVQAIQLLAQLGYSVKMTKHSESGRSAISKGLLIHAKKVAEHNVRTWAPLINEQQPLIGIEPSAILSFRDEYPRLVSEQLRSTAKNLARHCMTIEEFLVQEIQQFQLTSDQFHSEQKNIIVHGHCHQKALTKFEDIFTLLSLPEKYKVTLLDSGCCGMAGSFGYETEHYDISMKMGELRLFPAIRQAEEGAVFVASGTSCRHQIMDGTGVKALHAVEVLLAAVK